MGLSGCGGIGVDDLVLRTFFTRPSKHEQLADNEQGPLTLGDLEGIKPQYLSNIVVNEWLIGEREEELKYELLVMSPTEIERLDRRPGQDQFEGKLEPQDIKLSTAMATSAAAVARHMGAYQKSTESIKQLQIVLGLGMGASMISDWEGAMKEKCCWRVSICGW